MSGVPMAGSTCPTRAWLVHEYIDNERGCPEIGRQLGRDGKTIHKWIVDAGIQTRRRGHTREALENVKKGQGAFRGRRHTPEALAKIRAATIARGQAPYLRNGVHWLKGARPEDNPNWKGGVTRERQAFYNSREWKAACRAVWHRADAHCERCGLDHRDVRGEIAFHVHHVVSFAVKALRADPDNLRLLCITCHLWVHSRENTDGELIGAIEVAT